MKRLRMLLIASALMAGGTALASAQPRDHEDRGYRDRDDRHSYRDRDDRHFYRDRDDRRFDRDDRRWARRDFYRDDHRYFVGERRFVNGYYWTWDGGQWCRRDGGVRIYLGF